MGLLDKVNNAFHKVADPVGHAIDDGKKTLTHAKDAVVSNVQQGIHNVESSFEAGAHRVGQAIDQGKTAVLHAKDATVAGVQQGLHTVESRFEAGAHRVGQAIDQGKTAVLHAKDATVAGVQQGVRTVENGVTAGVQKLQSLNPFAPTPDKKFDGAMVGAGGKTYPANTPVNKVPPFEPVGGPRNNETLIYVNGIQTTLDTQITSLQKVADTTGSRVVGIHNSTDGIVGDLAQCVGDKLDKGKNPAVDTLANTVYDELKAGHPIHLMAHSQGGLITSRALSHVQQRLMVEDGLTREQAQQKMSGIKVETFGAAAMHYPDGPQYQHYVNRTDVVPNLVGLGPLGDKFNPLVDGGKGSHLTYVNEPHLDPLKSHSFDDLYLKHRVPFDQARAGN